MEHPKPAHLGARYAAQFQDRAIVATYHCRPPYPAAAFPVLMGLVPASARAVLDAGCGTGDLARRLAPLVERIDAVDASVGMIAAGKTMPGGDMPSLRWLVGRVEDVPLDPPYGLVTAGESLHWMEWSVVLPRFREMLSPGGVVAIASRVEAPSPWYASLLKLITRYSTNREFQPYDLIAELERRGLFARQGAHVIAPEPYTQSIEEYIESLHSRNGFSRDRMPPEDAAAFDAAVRTLLLPHALDGLVRLEIACDIVWGVPGGNERARSGRPPAPGK